MLIAIVVVVLVGLHAYVWVRLVRDTRLPQPWMSMATAALVALAAGLPLMRLLARRFPAVRAAGWPLYTWLGILFLFFVLLLSADIIRALTWAWSRLHASDRPAINLQRRTLLARAFAGAVTASTAALTATAVRAATGPVAVRRIPVTLARWPRSLDGLTLVQLTDMHVGPTIGRAFVESIVARTNELDPDVIAITGDLVDGTVRELGDAVAPLARLRARHGVYFVTGNHEYFSGATPWIDELTRLGIRCLRNERVSIGHGADSFELAGVDDHSGARSGQEGHGEDLDKALANLDPAREVVLLAHQPRSVLAAARFGVGLQISGHTHGGQIWPFSYLVRLQQPFIAGLHRHRETQIYVSRGTGYWGPPMRLGAPAEIAQIVLSSPATG
ncbi:MAG TPA: metallophosphoesterase [Polyangia bacterium]|nr:metallophosphoesterase [Polyangia bacterium]